MQADFTDVLSWRRWELPNIGQSAEGHQRGGPSWLYLNRGAPAYDEPMKPGTVLVKVVELGDGPEDWELHAMVKRGGEFNERGATGWEYFDLVVQDDVPVITWRGEGNAANPGGYGRALGGAAIGCNDCHALVGAGDYAFSRALFSQDCALIPPRTCVH